MNQARLLGHHTRADGTCDTFWSLSVPCRITEAPKGKTPYLVLLNGHWRRVYRVGSVCYLQHKSPGEIIKVDYLP